MVNLVLVFSLCRLKYCSDLQLLKKPFSPTVYIHVVHVDLPHENIVAWILVFELH